MKALSMLVCVGLGLGLALGFLFLAQGAAGAAQNAAGAAGAPPDLSAPILCVNPGGTGGCYSSIQAAVDAANEGGTIRVAKGTYSERVVVEKSVILQGGWDAAFTTRNWLANVTTIDAAGGGSVITIDGTRTPISPTVEGFHIIHGNASSSLGWGGGILVHGQWDNPGLATIRSNKISDNIACNLTSCQGYGGGITVYSNRATIEDNIIQNNIARAAGNGSGYGGGVALWGYPIDASMSGNVIEGNTGIISTTSTLTSGRGGGVWSDGSDGLIASDNLIDKNVAARKGTGYGGGIYASGNFYHNEVLSNTASVEGTGYGGGVYAAYTPDFHDNVVQGNIASQAGDGSGGGIYAIYLRDASGNTIEKNQATRGGGVYFKEYAGHQSFYNNVVVRNSANGLAASAPDGGGGIFSRADWVEITSNEIMTNTGAYGGGVLVTAGGRMAVEDNLIQGNIAYYGGGLYLKDSGGEVRQNVLDGNGAIRWGGGIYMTGSASPQMDSNLILGNTALGYDGFAAGGVAIAVIPSTHVTMTNTIIAGNIIHSGVASGVHCYSGGCSLIHCTVVDNLYKTDAGLVPGEGVRIAALGSPNWVWNSIIAGHSSGVILGGSPVVYLDYNDYYDNAVNVSGTSPGAHARFVDPQFLYREDRDFHLSSNSALINAGDSGLTSTHDFEGQLRILPDMGADEYIASSLYLPVVYKEYEPWPH